MKLRLLPLLLVVLLAAPLGAAPAKPNILVILADDLGYADVGFNGCKDIATPNLDALSKRSLRCVNGYVTHPFCSPTRAGLLTGRHQQRFGHENNPKWDPADTVAGLPVKETTLPQVLKTAGYRTGAVGKWHLGAHPQFHPNRRGFDDYFGALGGGHIYLPGEKGGAEYTIPLDRNGKPEPLTEYITDVFAREAAAFITRSKGAPWFLYLAFNAPHTPLQNPPRIEARVKHIADEKRRGYAGLVTGLDDGIGTVMKALAASGQAEDTLVFFFSDNGGPVSVTHSENTPLRGAKGDIWDGGMHTPFLISWPAKLPMGRDYRPAVSSLDVFATAVALTGATVPAGHRYEGVDLIPFLTGEKKGNPHEHLFWRTTRGGGIWAVRDARWKLAQSDDGKGMVLFDLQNDIGETTDLAAQQPEIVAGLRRAYDAWNRDNIPALFESPNAGAAKNQKKKK
jgi:arylsulfatase A-like enzyme